MTSLMVELVQLQQPTKKAYFTFTIPISLPGLRHHSLPSHPMPSVHHPGLKTFFPSSQMYLKIPLHFKDLIDALAKDKNLIY